MDLKIDLPSIPGMFSYGRMHPGLNLEPGGYWSDGLVQQVQGHLYLGTRDNGVAESQLDKAAL